MSISIRFGERPSSSGFPHHVRSRRDNFARGFSNLAQIALALGLFSQSVASGSAQSVPFDTCSSSVPKTTPLGIAVWNWMGSTATEKALRDLPAAEGTPTQAITALSGAAWTENGEKGNLRVEIAWDFQQESPGISEENLSRIEAAVREGDAVLADLSRKSWSDRQGMLPDEETPKQPAKPIRVCILDEENGTFRIATGNRGEIQRISRKEMQRAATAGALANLTWTAKNQAGEPFPADFAYKATLIKPGQYAFLALPFELQDKGGICTAASSLNVVKYLDPELDIKQKEVFALFNDSNGGASMDQVVAGLNTLGFEAELVYTKSADRRELLARIQASLDEGRPLVITKPGHALTMVGYCKATRKLIAWDQGFTRKGGNPAYLPGGGYEIPDTALQSRFDSVVFIRKAWTLASETERGEIAKIHQLSGDLRRHQIINANAQKETEAEFLRHAAEPKLKATLNAGRTPYIPVGKNKLVEIKGESEGKWNIVTWPEGKADQTVATTVARMLAANDGVFYSVRPSE